MKCIFLQIRNNFSHPGEHRLELLHEERGCAIWRGSDWEERSGDCEADAEAERHRWRLRQRQRGKQPTCTETHHSGLKPVLAKLLHLNNSSSSPQNLERNRQKKRAIGTLDVAFKKRFFALSGISCQDIHLKWHKVHKCISHDKFLEWNESFYQERRMRLEARLTGHQNHP